MTRTISGLGTKNKNLSIIHNYTVKLGERLLKGNKKIGLYEQVALIDK